MTVGAGGPGSVLVATDETLPAGSREATVVIAEDDRFDQLILRRAFAAASLRARIDFVEHGERLLHWFAARDAGALPRLVFMDLNMPVLDGWGVLRRMRADPATATLPIIVMSTMLNEEDHQRLLDAGATRYFAKPVRFEELVEVIRECAEPWLV